MGKDVDLLTDILVDTKRKIKNICKKMDNEEQAKILILHYIEYKSFSQIATICGMKVGKAKYTCKIARKKFGEIFETTRYSFPIDI
jgi:DNA-directed RNA polymerase specialized sigma24 family protein